MRNESISAMLLSVLSLLGCTKSSGNTTDGAAAGSAAAANGLPDRDPALAQKLVADGALLLDVRTQDEWNAGHLDGAKLVPIQQLASRLGEVEAAVEGDKNRPIVVYCRSGGRAGRAKKLLQQAGHKRVTNLGGMSDWPK